MGMKIHVDRRVTDEVYLSDQNVDEVTRARVRALLGHGEYLRFDENGNGFVARDIEYGHGSVGEEFVRKASKLDLAIFAVLGALE